MMRMQNYALVAQVLKQATTAMIPYKLQRSSGQELKQSVMVCLSCFLVITERFAAMELGQSVSITAGKYAGKAV